LPKPAASETVSPFKQRLSRRIGIESEFPQGLAKAFQVSEKAFEFLHPARLDPLDADRAAAGSRR